jgi:type IV pilus assembly protein PilM
MFFRKKQAVGLDISSDTVKVVRLKKQDFGIALIGIGMVKVSATEPIDEEAKALKFDLITKAIRKALSSAKIETKYVYSAVMGNAVVIRYIKLPKMTEAELKDVIKFEVEDHIPFDMDKVILDFQILREFKEREERMMEVLVVAAKEELIYEHIELLRRVNLETSLINVNTFAIQEIWEYTASEEEKKKIVAILDIGSRTTNVNIIGDRRSEFNRDILVGGNDFTEAIKRELKISFKEAEELKERHGRIVVEEEHMPVDERTAKASYALESVATKLLGELDRSFAYYYTQLPVYRKSVEEIVLSGGGARLTGLAQFIEKNLGIKTTIFDPFKKIRISPKFDQVMLRKLATHFAVSTGLALRGLLG